MDKIEEKVDIEISKDAKETLMRCLYDVMKKKNVLDPLTHQYLAEVMAQYVQWEDNEFSPSLNTRMTDPFCFQMRDANEKYGLNGSLLYQRFKAIGDTLLFSVGYWPESIYSTVRRERPSLEYYAETGKQAYQKAAQAIYRKKLSDERATLMDKMSKMFIPHAGVLYETRHTLGDTPVKNIKLLFEMSEILGDATALHHYLLKMQPDKNIQ